MDTVIVNKKSNIKTSSFIKGAFILGLCGFIGKLMGAIYRIPLTNILGAEGMGLYQMIFPIYALLLSVSSTGIPTALSNLIAERLAKNRMSEAGNLWLASLITLIVLGTLFSLGIAVFASTIASLQGNPLARLAYLGIAPSLLFVAVVSSFRGYFQGMQNMLPSSISQVAEQIAKMVMGLTLSLLLLPRGIEYGVLGASLGVAFSEFIAMLTLFIHYLLHKPRLPLERSSFRFFRNVKQIYALSIPVTLGGIIMPLTQVVDSALVIRILTGAGYSVANATALFGIAGGPVGSLINMPVVLSLAIATAIVPTIASSRSRGDTVSVRKKATLALQLTMLIALPCAVILAIFPEQIIGLLYGRGLSVKDGIDEQAIASSLLRLSSINVLLIAFIQVITSVLYALNKQFLPVRNLFFGAVIKILLSVLLLPVLGIYASVVSNTACFFTALVLNVISIQRSSRLEINFYQFWIAPLLAVAFMALMGIALYMLFCFFVISNIALLVALCLTAVGYGIMLIVLNAFDKNEVKAVPFLNKFIK